MPEIASMLRVTILAPAAVYAVCEVDKAHPHVLHVKANEAYEVKYRDETMELCAFCPEHREYVPIKTQVTMITPRR